MLILLQDVITVKHWHNIDNIDIIVHKLQATKPLTLHALLR